MKITAIICEYNPMTNGHLRHMELARTQTGADTILCVMSGSFVQRGDAAILDKYIRAEIAVRLGADIVVELPTIYAISPADNFAYGAIKTISAFPDVEYLSFGSECGDAELLQKTAELLVNEPKELKNLIQEKLKDGSCFPKARAAAVNEYAERNPEYAAIKGVLDTPNNVLGVAYILAILRAGLNIRIHTIKREGGEYNDEAIDIDSPSSSAVRRALAKEDYASAAKAVPPLVFDYIKNLKPNDNSLGDMILFKLKSINGYELENYYDISGGIHNRLKIAAASATTLPELLEAAKTKKFTMARLKRICLYILFDITKEAYEESLKCPVFVQILAIRKERKDILSALSGNCRNVLTRYSDVNRVDKSLRYLVKLDFTAQGTLDIINRSKYYNKKMLLI
jgi:predicted nucleotidyltransferase